VSNPIGEAVYEVLSDDLEDLGVTAVYVQGDVPDEAALPYLTYNPTNSTKRRLNAMYGQVMRYIQVDVMARTSAEAETIASNVEALIVGTSVAVTATSNVIGSGFELRDGVWRTATVSRPEVESDRYYRVILLFQQDETLTL
jgi:hypothetical protein